MSKNSQKFAKIDQNAQKLTKIDKNRYVLNQFLGYFAKVIDLLRGKVAKAQRHRGTKETKNPNL